LLKSDTDVLRLENAALESRVKQAQARAVIATPPPPASRPDDTARVKQLERERDDLQKQLAAANKELNNLKGKGTPARINELTGQITVLRARLEVFEARPVPYTSEELALFRQPQPAPASPNTGVKSVRELPAGAATLVAEAQRYFTAKQFDKAEERYLEVLRQDDKNVYTLANLAAIQLEMNHLDEAEKHIKQAIAGAPNDAYNLSILGYLKFRQEKYDEAFDALSRATQLDPQNAEIQNYLGVTLSHKGMRGPAETALRKAILLDPNYGAAHNNLAVIYLTQEPPLAALARWHYQKALAAGHPRNAELEKMLDEKSATAGRQ
jgi:tetratricopeptide (TPR) repeat protein